MKNITCIIADKDKQSREKLKSELGRFLPGLHLLGEAPDGDTAIDMIQNLNPEIVLMDIDMPPQDGFFVLDKCREQDFSLIVVTDSEKYALKAIKAGAVDYLLKPAGAEELETAFGKVREIRSKQVQDTGYSAGSDKTEQTSTESMLPIRVGSFYEMVSTNEIVFCKADNNYTEIILRDKRKFLLSKTLKYFENRLRSQNFCRIHQSFLVNIRFIKSIEKGKSSHMVLQDGTMLEIAQARKELIFGMLGF